MSRLLIAGGCVALLAACQPGADDAGSPAGNAAIPDADSTEAYAGIGEVRLEQDRLPEAAQGFQEALARNPRLASVHNSLGIVAALSGRREEAVSHFERAVALQPGAFEANLQRARAELAAGGASR